MIYNTTTQIVVGKTMYRLRKADIKAIIKMSQEGQKTNYIAGVLNLSASCISRVKNYFGLIKNPDRGVTASHVEDLRYALEQMKISPVKQEYSKYGIKVCSCGKIVSVDADHYCEEVVNG